MAKRFVGRGGPRREKLDRDIDDGVLLDCFGKHHALISNLGIYESKSTKDQPCGKGLLFLEPLIADIVAIRASCSLPIPLVRKALQRLVFQQPTVNKTIYNNALWGGLRQERLTCVCNHVRRLAREDERFRQTALKLTAKELQSLKALLSTVAAAGEQEPSVDDVDSDQETVFLNDGALAPGKKELKVNRSDVSMDSDGFPRMFSSPVKERSEAPKECEEPPAEAGSRRRRNPSQLMEAMQGAASAKKSRGASSGSGAAAAAAAPVVPGPVAAATSEEGSGRTYAKMFYKGPCSFGLRQSLGEKRQVISICKKGASKSDLEFIAIKAMEKLHDNGSEDAVRAWVQGKVAEL